MRHFKYLFLWFFSFLFCVGTSLSLKASSIESLQLLTSIYMPSYSLEFSPVDGGGQQIMQPNIKSLFRVGLYTDIIGGSWGFDVLKQNESAERKGETDYVDYRFNFVFNPIQIKLNYNQYKGFFLPDHRDATASHILYPNMDVVAYGVGMTWIFSHERYSLDFALNHIGVQKKSGGSWLLGLDYTQNSYKNPNDIILASLQPRFGADSTLFQGSFHSLGVSLGYGYSYVWGNWFISGLLQTGFNTYQSRFKTQSGSFEKSDSDGGKFQALLALGYNNQKWSLGLSGANDNASANTNTVKVTSSVITAELFLTYKFF